MSLVSKYQLPIVLANPLDLPLKLSTKRGRFGAKRGTNCVAEPDGSGGTYTRPRYHEGIDFISEVDKPVYAAESGIVSHVDTTYDDAHLTIDHHPTGLGFCSRYLHLRTTFVSVGDRVNRGQKVGTIANYTATSTGPHLHFELRKVINSGGALNNDRNSMPVDPTKALFLWDEHYHGDEDTVDEVNLDEVGVVRRNGIDYFQIRHSGNSYIIPLYEPSEGELALMNVIQNAFFNNKKMRLALRNTHYFGESRKIIVRARVLK